MKLFSGSANKPLTQNIANALGIGVSPTELHLFPDGERRVRIEENVLDQDTVVVQPTNPPVDENYMELFFLVDGLKRSGAKSITAIIPYLGYQRQDHVFREGEAVSLAVVINLLEKVGATKVIAFDFHSIKIPEFFTIPVTHLSALPLFAKHLQQELPDFLRDASLVSPDMGGIRRIKIFSELLGNMTHAAIEKNRDLASGRVEAELLHGNVAKNVVILDDMISSGKTILAAANLLRKKGVEHIVVCATHAIFADEAQEILQKANVDRMIVSDTVYIPKDKRFTGLEIVSVAEDIAKALQ